MNTKTVRGLPFLAAIVAFAQMMVFAQIAAFAQIGAGCTPESMNAVKAGSIVVKGVGRWDCYAVNYGSNPEPFSLAMFALDFPELHMIPAPRVADIVQVKQSRTAPGIAVRIIGYLLIAAAVGTGAGVGHVDPLMVSRLALGALAAGKISDQLNKDIPPSGPFVSGMFAGDTTLQPFGKPGFSIGWTVYSSLIGPRGTQALGPRLISRPETIQWIRMPVPPPGTNIKFTALPIPPPGTN